MEVVLTIVIGVVVIVIGAILVAAGRWLWGKFRVKPSVDSSPIDYEKLAGAVLRQFAEHGMSAGLTEVREQAPPPQTESAHPEPVPRAVHIGTEDLVKAKLPGMSLDAPATVFVGETFKVTVLADPAPNVGFAGFQSEVLFPEELTWEQSEACEDEVVPRPAGGSLQVCLAGLSTLLAGAQHTVISEVAVPPLAALDVVPNNTTPLVELDFVCNTLGSYKLTLTAVPDSAFGAAYSDLNANPLKVKTTEVDGHQVADAIIIECGERLG